MKIKEIDKEILDVSERLNKVCSEHILITMCEAEDELGIVPIYAGQMSYEAIIAGFSIVLNNIAKETGRSLELISRDFNTAMKLAKEKGQAND